MDHRTVRSEVVNGFTVEVRLDEEPGDSNPREFDDSNYLWLGFPHRHYIIGDEQIDPRTFSIECRACHGEGQVEQEGFAGRYPCEVCDGYGTEAADGDLGKLIELVKHHYKARIVKQVGMCDHSGVSYYLTSVPLGTCGLLVATEEQLNEWGIADYTDDEIVEQMRAEIAYYSAWAAGEVYFVEVTDCNGDTVESLGGFIGDTGINDAFDEGKSIAEAHTPPEPTYFVPRMTAEQLRAASEGLIRHGHTDLAERVLSHIAVKESA